MTDERHPPARQTGPGGGKKHSGTPTHASDRPAGRDGQHGEDRKPPGRRDGRPGEAGKPAGRPAGRHGDGRPGDGQPGEDRKPRGAAAALIELDRELMKLLVRRATLVSRMRGGRDHAATPAAIQAEKAVRVAWETEAPAFSKDPRFVRQLFSLLQDIKVLTREQAEASGVYNLAPAQKPVSGSMTGPTSARAAQMRIALAACLGLPLVLEPVMLSAPLLDCVKAFSQAGASVAHDFSGKGRITLTAGKPASFADVTLFAGDDPFTLHLAALLAAGGPGVCRLTGGARLKEADLSALRNLLPLFGARLAHIVPHSKGLPANLECSGELPPLVVVPAETSFEALCALLLAPLAWNAPITLNLAAVPAGIATAALAEVRPLHREAGADVETHGPHLVYTPGPLSPPEHPALPLDPAFSAYVLALPLFAGGSVTLSGPWPDRMPEAAQAEQLLAWAGLDLARDENGVTASVSGAEHTPPLQLGDLAPELGPLYLALRARASGRDAASEGPAPDLFPDDETDASLAESFLARLGIRYEGDRFAPDTDNAETAAPWTGPSAWWGMAFALCSFVRPGLKLANPGIVTEGMPPFWRIFNSLPAVADPPAPVRAQQPEEPQGDKPARRRIIAD